MAKVRSALGQIVDFDLLAIQNSFNSPKPKPRPVVPQVEAIDEAISYSTTAELTNLYQSREEAAPLVVAEPQLKNDNVVNATTKRGNK